LCYFSNRFSNLGDADEKQVNELKEQLNQKLDVYDKILSNQPYLAGQVNIFVCKNFILIFLFFQTFTLADLFHLPYGAWLVKIGEEDLFNSRPNVKKWWEKITSRSSWKTVQSMT